jgi:basic membrane protein A
VKRLILEAKKGQFPSSGFFYAPPGYAPYHDLAGKVPPDVEEMMQGILAGFLKGTLKTGVSPARP